ncbi:MAG TPA: hypothetical protein VHM28_05720, partial [Anaerolineales bacterium]|nr:hypothetical protein [Anaerolineales bacterium]
VFTDESTRSEAAQRLLERATTVEAVIHHPVAWNDAAQAFARAFETKLNLRLEEGKLSESERRRAEELVREKYDHGDWTQRV